MRRPTAKALTPEQLAALEKGPTTASPTCFVCRNVTMLLLVLPGFLLGVDVLYRNVDDFKHNAAYQHAVEGVNSQPPPCGLATPDPLELLKALDRENGFLNIYQIIFQDYDKWNNTIHHGLCGLNFADWPDGSDAAKDPGEEYRRTRSAPAGGSPERFSGQYTIGRELAALSKIMKRDGFYPINNPNDGYQTLWTKYSEEFCDEDDGALRPRERRIYAIKERIAKAYVTAAPAFFRTRCGARAPTTATSRSRARSPRRWPTSTPTGCRIRSCPTARASSAASKAGIPCLLPNSAHIGEVLAAAGSYDNLARMVGAGPRCRGSPRCCTRCSL